MTISPWLVVQLEGDVQVCHDKLGWVSVWLVPTPCALAPAAKRPPARANLLNMMPWRCV